MPKRTYEATFYYQVTLVREGTIEVDVPEDAAPDFNPFAEREVADVLGQHEGQLGEAEMLVDDESPEGERLTDILLQDPESGHLIRATRIDGLSSLVDAPVDFAEEDEEEEQE